MTGTMDHTDEWVSEVTSLQARLSEKLQAIGFLNTGEDDLISHHLAEVSFGGSVLSSRLVPEFLRAQEPQLGNLAVDLVEDLREMKEAIEAMEATLIQLMNHLNP